MPYFLADSFKSLMEENKKQLQVKGFDSNQSNIPSFSNSKNRGEFLRNKLAD